MKESVTYQEILAEGTAKALRNLLLHKAEKKFKEPADAAIRATLEAVTSADALEQLVFALDDANSWKELIPATRSRSRKRKS